MQRRKSLQLIQVLSPTTRLSSPKKANSVNVQLPHSLPANFRPWPTIPQHPRDLRLTTRSSCELPLTPLPCPTKYSETNPQTVASAQAPPPEALRLHIDLLTKTRAPPSRSPQNKPSQQPTFSPQNFRTTDPENHISVHHMLHCNPSPTSKQHSPPQILLTNRPTPVQEQCQYPTKLCTKRPHCGHPILHASHRPSHAMR